MDSQGYIKYIDNIIRSCCIAGITPEVCWEIISDVSSDSAFSNIPFSKPSVSQIYKAYQKIHMSIGDGGHEDDNV